MVRLVDVPNITNPITSALTAKGPKVLLSRAGTIVHRYGWSPGKMIGALGRFVEILHEFGCGATFPITALALQRHGRRLARYQFAGIEFAIHGYRHIDHRQLSLREQADHLERAGRIFARVGILATGFRSPYLRWNADTLAAVKSQGLAYDSSQALVWDVVESRQETDSYRRVKRFYGALDAASYVALPRLEDGLVCIPYSIPDDEALVERLQMTQIDRMAEIWLGVLQNVHQLGELFTLGLHPERIALCEGALKAVLARARSLWPSVWIARLNEIAAWWGSRAETTYRVRREAGDCFRLTVNGPTGTTVLVRSVAAETPTEPWANGYRRALSSDFVFRAGQLPFIGISPTSPPALADFLRQQGYLIEPVADAQACSFYLNPADFAPEDERPLLARIEKGTWPLLRLARWPDGAQSALSVTGDIDALTLRDYGARLFGS